MTWLVIGAIGLIVGLAVGAVGIGGPVMVPVLVMVGGLGVHEALATAMVSFVVLGAAWTILYWRRGSASLATNVAVGVTGIPAQYVGARIATVSDAPLITLWFAIALMVLGVLALRPPSRPAGIAWTDEGVGRLAVFAVVGAFAGLANGLVSSGGGMFGVPILLALGYAPLAAISSMLVLSVGGTLAGAAGWIGTGFIRWPVAGLLAIVLTAGCVWGVHVAHRIPALVLRRIAATVCIVMGVVLLVR